MLKDEMKNNDMFLPNNKKYNVFVSQYNCLQNLMHVRNQVTKDVVSPAKFINFVFYLILSTNLHFINTKLLTTICSEIEH